MLLVFVVVEGNTLYIVNEGIDQVLNGGVQSPLQPGSAELQAGKQELQPNEAATYIYRNTKQNKR